MKLLSTEAERREVASATLYNSLHAKKQQIDLQSGRRSSDDTLCFKHTEEQQDQVRYMFTCAVVNLCRQWLCRLALLAPHTTTHLKEPAAADTCACSAPVVLQDVRKLQDSVQQLHASKQRVEQAHSQLQAKVQQQDAERRALEAQLKQLSADKQQDVQEILRLRGDVAGLEMQLYLQGDDYYSFIQKVDRTGQIARVLEVCNLDDATIIDTPAGILCRAAALPAMTPAKLHRLKTAIFACLHSDHTGGDDAPAAVLNQVYNAFVADYAAHPAAALQQQP